MNPIPFAALHRGLVTGFERQCSTIVFNGEMLDLWDILGAIGSNSHMFTGTLNEELRERL